MKFFKWSLIAALVLLFAGGLFAQEKKATYVGVKGCKTCHKKEKAGAQFAKWKKAKHSKAYETLASPEALKFAKERGIENPQKAKECLKCHVTAYDADASMLGKKYAIEDGVGCESCHGAGSLYKKKKTMKALRAGKIDPASVGLIIPTEKTCLGCHNDESPTFKSFDFEKMKEKIAHPVPEK